MNVYWTSKALQDRLEIWAYILADNPSAGARMDELFSAAAARLSVIPNPGKQAQFAEPGK